MGSRSKRTVRGFMHFLGIHFVICHGPVDSFQQLWFEDKCAWSGSAMDTVVNVSAASLFGGYRRGLGVWGPMSINGGGATQGQDSYLRSRLGADVPAFRGVFSIVFRKMQLGFSDYLKKPAFMVSRIHTTSGGGTQWYDAKSAIGTDMNPIHIIRECLTDPMWGMGYAETDIDDVAFEAAADTLYDEGMGISILWNKGTRLQKFVNEVKKHINASLYVSRETGQFKIKLIRDDYVVDDLFVLDQSNVVSITNFRRMAVSDLTSEVTIIYSDSESGEDATVTARNLALANQQGSAVGARLEYKGFTSRSIATLVANRELKTLSIPLVACTIYANQTANHLNIGDAVKLTYERYGIETLVMRIGSIEFGNISDNVIRIQCAEDIFGTSDIEYTVPPATSWLPIIGDPIDVEHRLVHEAAYWDIVLQLGDLLAEGMDEDSCFWGATGVRPINQTSSAALYTKIGYADWQEVTATDQMSFCPSGTITTEMSKTDTTIDIENVSGESMIIEDFYAMIEDEVIVITAVSYSTDIDGNTTGTISINRGCGDTVPEIHPINSRIFFSEDYYASDEIEYANASSISIRMCPVTSTAELPLEDATTETITFASRIIRPYPPGRFQINGEYYPDTVDGELLVTWVGRNRITQSGTLIDTSIGNITEEAGTTYKIVLKNAETDTVINTLTGITGLSRSVLSSEIGGAVIVELKLMASRDGFDSWQSHSQIFYYNIFSFENDDKFLFENGDYFQFE